MNTFEDIKVAKKYTDAFLKCSVCLYGNNFIIEIKKEGTQHYYLERCPKCSHVEEFCKISHRVAQDYLPSIEK